MKRYLLLAILSVSFLTVNYAQNPENDQIRIKIDANVNGETIKIDTSINHLSDFDIDGFLQELGIENELEQLNIDINNGFDFDFEWDEDAFEEMMEGLENIEMPALPAMPELPEMADMAMGWNKALLGVYTDKVAEGAKITGIIENSGAAAAGLKEGDIIIKIDERTIESPSNLSEVIGLYEPNTAVKVTYIRDGNTQTVTATLKENDDYVDWENMEWPQFDSMNFKWDEGQGNLFEMDGEPHGFLGVYLDDADGKVLINGIEENSAAQAAGLKEGDILKEIDGKKIESYDQVIEIMHATKPGDKIMVTYEREGKEYKTEATLKENKQKMYYWKHDDEEEGKEDGYAPNIIIDHIMPCPPGSVYSYNSVDGKKNVNVCITVVTKKDKETAPSTETIMNGDHPLLNPNNLSIYSNPTNDAFNVKFFLPDAGDVKIMITDLNGQEVYSEAIDNFSGAYDKTISLGAAAAKGTYFVKVSQNGYSSTKTVVLQ